MKFSELLLNLDFCNDLPDFIYYNQRVVNNFGVHIFKN